MTALYERTTHDSETVLHFLQSECNRNFENGSLFFMRVLPLPINEKVSIARKRLIAASPEQFSWISQLIAHQKWYQTSFLKDVYYFYYFNIVIRFFFFA